MRRRRIARFYARVLHARFTRVFFTRLRGKKRVSEKTCATFFSKKVVSQATCATFFSKKILVGIPVGMPIRSRTETEQK
jgi:hypothetical protein